MIGPIFVGTDNQEMLRILWTGFQDGAAYTRRHPSVMSYVDADRMMDAAQRACERVLEVVEPLDRGLFHPAYTHGWIAGYLATYHDHGDAEGLSLFAPAATGQDISQEVGSDTH